MEKIEEILRKEIKDLQTKLERPLTNKTFDIASLNLSTLYLLVDELELDIDKKEIFRKKNIYREDKLAVKRVTKNYLESLEFHDKYLSNIYLFDEKKYEKYIPNVKEDEDAYIIAASFLKEKFPNLFLELKRILDEGKFYINNKETKGDIEVGGLTFGSIKAYTPYVVVKDSPYINLAHEIVHEITHSYMFYNRINLSKRRQVKAFYNTLEEVLPHFINLVLDDELKNTEYETDSKKYIKDLKEAYLMKLKEFKNFLNNETLDAYQYIENTSYAYGIAIACLFFDRYKIDKKQALKEIEEFLQNQTKYSFLKTLKKSNLDQDLIDKKILLKYI